MNLVINLEPNQVSYTRWGTLILTVALICLSAGCQQNRYQPADWEAYQPPTTLPSDDVDLAMNRFGTLGRGTLPGRFGTLPGRFGTLPGRFGTLPGRFGTLPGRLGTLPSRGTTLPLRGREDRRRLDTLPTRRGNVGTLPRRTP